MPDILAFSDALDETQSARRHLLLGNGFSIALFPGRFTYRSLLEQADFSDNPEVRAAFDALGTTDFEFVLNALRQTATLLPLYGIDDATLEKVSADAERLKEVLVAAIAGRHPERPSEISGDQYGSVRRFLAAFAGEARGSLKGKIYTLNYDLLLYWSLLHDENLSVDPDHPFRIHTEHLDSTSAIMR
jgi:hypothetical protein